MPIQPQPDFLLRLRPLPVPIRERMPRDPTWHSQSPDQRLRAALKVLLRRFGLRNLGVREVPPESTEGRPC